MSIKFLVLGGGGYFGFWGGGVPILFLWAGGFFWNVGLTTDFWLVFFFFVASVRWFGCLLRIFGYIFFVPFFLFGLGSVFSDVYGMGWWVRCLCEGGFGVWLGLEWICWWPAFNIVTFLGSISGDVWSTLSSLALSLRMWVLALGATWDTGYTDNFAMLGWVEYRKFVSRLVDSV